MARVAVLSDTHSYDDLRETVPGWVRAEVESADDTLHAGDFATPTALAFFRELAAELVAVRGNADVGVDLPEVATLTVEGVRLVVTHPPDVADASGEPTTAPFWRPSGPPGTGGRRAAGSRSSQSPATPTASSTTSSAGSGCSPPAVRPRGGPRSGRRCSASGLQAGQST